MFLIQINSPNDDFLTQYLGCI